MPSSSPGYVNSLEDPEDAVRTVQGAVQGTALTAVSPPRAPAQKRARGSPTPTTTPARPSALALLGNLTDSVRASAVRRLRALTDSIERPNDDASSSGSSASRPPSPTDAVRAVSSTPHGKRRRTALTDARTRNSHADWRGTQWDYTSAMLDKNLHRVGDTGPSVFAFPEDRPTAGDGSNGAQTAQDAGPAAAVASRPPSAMSAASAPAALSTPRSRHGPAEEASSAMDESSVRGWIVAANPVDIDPFAIAADTPMHTDSPVEADEGNEDEERDRFVHAVRDATALLTEDNVNSPDACGALLAFQARLRALDPYGNFASPSPTGAPVAAEMRDLRRAVDEIAAAQRATAETLQTLVSMHSQAPPAGGSYAGAAGQPVRTEPRSTDKETRPAAGRPLESAAPPARPPHAGPQRPAAVAGQAPAVQPPVPTPAGVIPRPRGTGQAKAIGRHDERRAVFRPATPFGGRLPAKSAPEDVRRLNLSSYLIRDSVNAALRDWAVAQMDESSDPVQVTAVNWTDRGNLCMITCEGFIAAELLLRADVAAEAAALGQGWKASRDVPVYKAVLRGVPTKLADGRMLTEDEILGDLRAHSSAFNSLALADAAEPASWISRDEERALRDHSTLVLNLATAEDAAKLLTMQRRLFVFGRACEPGAFQPRERERVCGRCWNPIARHRERDFVCNTRCRLCGERHAEEDHACGECDVLAQACVHIPLKCVNCTQRHAADDNSCAFRRRMRGTTPSAPPMASPGDAHPARAPAQDTPGQKRKKGKRVRVLDPHEPFPDDTAPAARATPTTAPAPAHASTAPQPPAAPEPTLDPREATPEQASPRARRKRAPNRRKSGPRPTPAPTTPPAPQDRSPAGAAGQEADVDPWAPPAHSAGQSVELDDSDLLALQDLVGDPGEEHPASPAPGTTAHTPAPAPASSASSAGAPTRRTPLPRAAAEADRDARRRRAAHVLRREFSFLKLSDAIAALRTCSDDYTSAVSWAAEAQAERRKPGMQGKSKASLQRLVLDMTAAAAKDTPRTGTDTAPTPVDA